MKENPELSAPQSRQRVRVKLRRVTQSAVVAATASTALIGVLVAKEHPGTSSTVSATARPVTTSSTSTPTSTSPAAKSTSATTATTTTTTTASSTTPTTTTKSATDTSGGT